MIKNQNDIPKVRILVVGDSGVGKTTLIHRLCHGCQLKNARWTIGCCVDVMLYEYKQRNKNFFVEFWDVGGAKKYKSTRNLFYSQVNGIMFVYDVSNSRSYHNLRKWIREILNAHKQQSIEEKYIYTGDFLHITATNSPHRRGATGSGNFFGNDVSSSNTTITAARSLGSLPVLVVGSKFDVLDEAARMNVLASNPFNSMKDFGMEGCVLSGMWSLDAPLPVDLNAKVRSSLSSSSSSSSTNLMGGNSPLRSSSNFSPPQTAVNDPPGNVMNVDLECGNGGMSNTTPLAEIVKFIDQVIERRYYRTEKTLEKRSMVNSSHVYARRESLAHTIYTSTNLTTSHMRSYAMSININNSNSASASPTTTDKNTSSVSVSTPP